MADRKQTAPRLQDAEPAELARRPDVPEHRPLFADRPHYSRPRRRTSCRSSSTARAGASTPTSSSSTRRFSRRTSRPARGPAGRSGATPGPTAACDTSGTTSRSTRRDSRSSRGGDKDWKALIDLCKVLNQTPPDQLEAALRPILDIDGVLWFLAVDNALDQQRRLLDPRQRLQHLPRREGQVPRRPARHERGLRPRDDVRSRGLRPAGGRSASARRTGPPGLAATRGPRKSTSTRWSAWTTPARPCRSRLLAVPSLPGVTWLT